MKSKKSPPDSIAKHPHSLAEDCLLSAQPSPVSGENCNMKEVLFDLSCTPLDKGDNFDQSLWSVSSELPSPVSVQKSGQTPHVTHRPIKVLRLRGGAGENNNHEANETPGCPESFILSFYEF